MDLHIGSLAIPMLPVSAFSSTSPCTSSTSSTSTTSNDEARPQKKRKRRAADALEVEERRKERQFKNRLHAQASREKHRSYIESLEAGNEAMKSTNALILLRFAEMESENASLKSSNALLLSKLAEIEGQTSMMAMPRADSASESELVSSFIRLNPLTSAIDNGAAKPAAFGVEEDRVKSPSARAIVNSKEEERDEEQFADIFEAMAHNIDDLDDFGAGSLLWEEGNHFGAGIEAAQGRLDFGVKGDDISASGIWEEFDIDQFFGVV